MLRAMVFIDYENFSIAFKSYYESIAKEYVRIDYAHFPQELIRLLPAPHCLTKTTLFYPKPDPFLMQSDSFARGYAWATGLRNIPYFAVVEGRHVARPAKGLTKEERQIDNSSTYYIEEKGTDVNLAVQVVSKAMSNAFDTAIIVSGDTDYMPVVQTLNTIGKSIVMVGMKTQNLSAFRQYSDQCIQLDDSFFQKCKREDKVKTKEEDP